ncbi:hypothetical protein MK786_13010 [Microbacterium sp. CFH 31415]|uniref:hypothetical protein n=1 Tax=Microbacterium sp. CFH 31415 TaxID=2921732 RepID=UPI001F14014C|nr:hypothetical protein [Microbacterium sp. CFH 31415]MCH6231664.1 hypothetical protein [Microbacterium sp. CFH 31415]
MTVVPSPRRRIRRAVGLAAAATVVAAGLVSLPSPASAVPSPPPEADVYLVSRTDEGSSGAPYITPDGQRVAYASDAGGLVEGTQVATRNIFLATAKRGSGDPFSGRPRLVSRPDGSLPDEPANDVSDDPVASADGRYVAFVSQATNLVPEGATPGLAAVYVRDMSAGTTFRVDAGPEPNGAAYEPDLSDDGRHLVFTSTATNLTPGDTNGAPDVFVADLDSNGDGTLGDVAVTRLLGSRSVPGGTAQPAISGDGAWIAFTAFLADPTGASGTSGDVASVFRTRRGAEAETRILAAGAHHGAVDATGSAYAVVVDDCQGDAVVAGVTLDAAGTPFAVGIGRIEVERGVGSVWAPAISADGSTVAWATTQPDAGRSEPLADPVVRVAEPAWEEARAGEMPCAGDHDDATELGVGDAPTLSASGRTVAFGGPSDMTSAETSVTAVDRRTHDGLWVSNTMGGLTVPGYVTSVAISEIPVSAVAAYAGALADVPIQRLPVSRLPLTALPIHRLPVHRLLDGDSPIYRQQADDATLRRVPIDRLALHRVPLQRPDIPGGWQQVLAATPFAGRLTQSVTLAEVLGWADRARPGRSSGGAAEAATLIRSLSLGDVDLDGSGIDALSVGSLLLGAAPLPEVEVAGSGSPLERWQALADAQGLGVTADDTTYLAELDAAGLDLSRTGVDAVPLNQLPLDATMLDDITLAASGRQPGLFLAGTPLGAVEVDSLSTAAQTVLFGGSRSGTLAENAGALRPSATLADLAAGAPDSVTVGTALFSLIDRAAYPWEQIDPTVIPAGAAVQQTADQDCDEGGRCGRVAQFQFTFDPGPGEATLFPAPTASVTLPASSRLSLVRATGSGPRFTPDGDQVYDGPVQAEGSLVRFPLPDTAGGTVRSLSLEYTASRQPGAWSSRAELTSADLRADDEILLTAAPEYYDVADHNRTPDGQWQAIPQTLAEGVLRYEWISPASIESDDEGRQLTAPADDEDWFSVEPPKPGQRLVVSSHAADGGISLALLKPAQTLSPLGLPSLGVAPGTAVTEQEERDAAAPAESGADTGTAVPGHVLLDQATVGGDGTVTVQASSAFTEGEADWLVRVTSGNGLAGSQLYSLRATYLPEPPEQRCAPWLAPLDVEPQNPDDPWPFVVSDPVGAATNTLYLIDTTRFRLTHGLQATDEVIAAIRALDGTGTVGDATISGAILSIDTDPAVVAARAALDQEPCSLSARRSLTAAITAFVTAAVGPAAEQIESIVIVGGDDIVPFAPVPQHAAQFTEASHAAELRLPAQPDGTPCPAGLRPGEVDPCATPLSAAAAAGVILTDDPYGLADAYPSFGGHLYVPTVAVGRLVDTADQIRGQLDRFRYADGVLAGDSALTGAYGAWAELPQLVSEKLAWRLGGDESLEQPWSRQDAESRLFPRGADAPRIVSLNAHSDERRLVAGVEDAATGAVDDSAVIDAGDHAPPAVPRAEEVFDPRAPTSPLDGAVVFMIGGHAGNNLPAAYYGDVTDWADVFSPAGGFVGNTGFGLANGAATAFSERLLGLYADWIGVQSARGPVSSGGALAYAKQAYAGALGLYSGYDEKVLMQAVYYGMPMYTFEDSTKEAPLPAAPELRIADGRSGLSSAPLTLTPSFATVTREDLTGAQLTYVTVGDEQPIAVPGQPLLPRLVTQIPSSDEAGRIPRGALITSLTSSWTGTVRPAIGDPGIGIERAPVVKDGLAFPSSFTSISRQETPSGPVSLLVTAPANVQSATGGLGRIETFPSMGLEILYGPDDGDVVPPMIRWTQHRDGEVAIAAQDAGGEVARVVLLVQEADAPADDATRDWEAVELELDTDGIWRGDIPVSVSGPYRWIAQAVDASGNVATDSARGRIQVAGAAGPVLGAPGGPLTVNAGDRVVRSIPITEAAPGAVVTGSYLLLDAGGRELAAGPVTVATAADGAMHAVVDLIADTPGTFQVSVTACSGGQDCGEPAGFALTVQSRNSAPTASVSLDREGITPGSLLTAEAAGADPDGGDVVTLSYRWLRNGVLLDGAEVAMLSLDGVTRPGDVIRVEVVPNDGETDGHAASAEIVVGDELALPTIAAWATSAGDIYDDGSWASDDVVVSFTCTGTGVSCPVPFTVSADTDSTRVERTISDVQGRQATAGITVRRDATAPSLSPSVTPDPVAVGGTATAVPAAIDTGSGIAVQSCDQPVTATEGVKRLTCRATDVAGNSAVTTVAYTVIGPAGSIGAPAPGGGGRPPAVGVGPSPRAE